MSRYKFIPLLCLIIVFSCFKKSQGLRQSDMQMLINNVLSIHAQYNNIDDKISMRIYKNYIDSLDYGKYYFYKSDLANFKKHELLFDDYLVMDDYKAVYDIFAVYKKRTAEAMDLFDELIKKNYDFKKDETITVDREKVAYAADKKEMSERWRKNIKLQLLNYTSSGKTVDEAKKKLIKKYELTRKRISEIDESRLLSLFMNSITASFDPHTNYLTYEEHEDFRISMQLKLEGIGVRLSTEDGFVKVESIITGGATAKLPENIILKPNDRIVAVAQAGGEPVDVIDMDLRNVVKLIRGEKGSEVRLTIIRESSNGDKPMRMIVPIVREEIKLQDSDAESHIQVIKTGGTKCKIGYIKLPSFYEDADNNKSSSGDVKKLLQGLKEDKVNIVVLDLRGNPGGLLTEAIKIMGLFIEEGPVLQVKNKANPARIYYDNDPDIEYAGPLVVLVDKFSASASEILAGAVKDYRRGVIIGPSNTYGKGTVQTYNPLGGELGAIKITTHVFYQPGGTSNQLYGIAPDVKVPDLSAIWNIGEDETKYPLKWEKIRKAQYRKFSYVSPNIVNRLKALSSKRTETKEYRLLKEKIEKYRIKLKKKTMSLREESDVARQKEKEMKDKIKDDRENKGIDFEKDLFLREAMNITGDYYRMMGR